MLRDAVFFSRRFENFGYVRVVEMYDEAFLTDWIDAIEWEKGSKKSQTSAAQNDDGEFAPIAARRLLNDRASFNAGVVFSRFNNLNNIRSECQ